ncbi:hypothetical protein [Egicoccus sp. AB-alg2]|uniref:hypothetical protein n=1 Tax=Egicoccus sp. AB-alg2 TaxID=3242693 RepID=UPI00359F0554
MRQHERHGYARGGRRRPRRSLVANDPIIFELTAEDLLLDLDPGWLHASRRGDATA